MLEDFGVIAKGRTGLTQPTRHELVHTLQEFLATLVPLQAHAVVVVDEAQHVQPDVMEEIRLVSNVHDDRGTMLQIVLVGQPDLERLLSRPELAQLKQRVSRYARLEPLAPEEVTQYIEHRLAIGRERRLRGASAGRAAPPNAGAFTSDAHVTFTPDAVAAVSRLSRGIPRLVNLLCDRALEAAFALRTAAVDESSVQTAARALALPEAPASPASWQSVDFVEEVDRAPLVAAATRLLPRDRRSLIWAASIALAALVVWFGVRAFLPSGGTQPPQPTAAAPSSGPSTAPTAPPAAASNRAAPQTPPPNDATAEPARSNPEPPATGGEARAAGEGPAPASPSAAAYEIVVASFRTEGRATSVAADLTTLGLPVRRRVASGWQQVLAGPFGSRASAEEAQQRMDRAGFGGTQIVPATR
jgi:general secretion pathway protein A